MKKILIYLLILLLFFQSTYASDYQKIKNGKIENNKNINIVIWNSKDGLERLYRSNYKDDFYNLVNFFQPQSNPIYCGIASAVIILNALNTPNIESQKSLEIILSDRIIKYPSYSQETFLNKKTDKIKNSKIINAKSNTYFDPGVNLKDLAEIIKNYGAKVDLNYVSSLDKKSIGIFREKLKLTLGQKNKYIIANFYGEVIGLSGGGHHSPIVAYNKKSDSIMILDVSYKRPWFWVSLEDFYRAMFKKDNINHRGYLEISKQ